MRPWGFTSKASSHRTVRGLVAAAFAACTLLSALPARAEFQAPSGWEKVTAGKAVVYRSGDAHDGFFPNINIVKEDFGFDTQLAGGRNTLVAHGAHVDQDSAVRCLPGYHADMLSYDMVSQGRLLSYVQMILGNETSTYIVTYTRPAGSEPEDIALQSLISICSDS